jgi:hypothetical protein
LVVFNVGQQAAVRAAFKLAGYDGPIRVLRVVSEDERGFVVPAKALRRMANVRDLEQVLTQLLYLKAWVMAESDRHPDVVPFE